MSSRPARITLVSSWANLNSKNKTKQKMGTGQSPSLRGEGLLYLSNSPTTAVHNIHCFIPLVYFSVDAFVVASFHGIPSDLSRPSHAVN